MLSAFLLSILASVLVSALPGPLGAFCAQTTVARGRAAGMKVGYAIAAGQGVHAFIASLAAFDPRAIPQPLRITLACVVAAVMLILAWRSWRVAAPLASGPARGIRGGLAGVFLLSLLTPGTLPGYVLVFTTFGLPGVAPVPVLTVGALIGSVLWWSFVCIIADLMRDRLELAPLLFSRACGALFLLGALAALRAAIA